MHNLITPSAHESTFHNCFHFNSFLSLYRIFNSTPHTFLMLFHCYYYLLHSSTHTNIDNRLDGKSLPLPPHQNGTQWGQATAARNVERYCTSNNPCTNAFCPEPFECVDLWNKYECRY